MTVRIKICGITREGDALAAVQAGADALGFLFYPKSKRHISPEQARDIIRALPPLITAVGVFANERAETIAAVRETCGLDAVQLHGEETPEFCRSLPGKTIKAFRLRNAETLAVAQAFSTGAWLFDGYSPNQRGGAGLPFNWEWIRQSSPLPRPFIVAGGLTPANVGNCIKTVRPYAVDVSSGVEEKAGKKDMEKMRRFVAAVRKAAAEIDAPTAFSESRNSSPTTPG